MFFNNTQFQKALIITAIGGCVYWLFRARNAKPSKAEPAKEISTANAKVVATAYMKAIHAGEGAEGLEELNRLTEKEYGMRVYRKHQDGKYYVMDTKGNDVFKIS